ncbi:SPARC-related modular calcium-binding protein 1 isoform X4 [Takifugu rubripes]|uniref:SPARC-related modular calcium-binding protein 1 isoform X4 n=1 Tax=Takifugu rubripes TaxID=31033 RepID=UPI001145223F|nr:SPARC-related modular calcium-binding protein 1 isoform X4 [Takifugu rubripes]
MKSADMLRTSQPPREMLSSALLFFTFSHFLAAPFLSFLPHVSAQKPASRWLIGDRDSHCGVICTRTQVKPVCGSDGRSYESACELQRARCRDKTLTVAPRGRCRGRNWAKIDQLPAAPAPTSASEVRDPEVKGSVTEKPPGPSNSGRKVVSFIFFLTLNPDDGSRPPPTMETHVPAEGDEITGPTLWNKQRENKQNSSSSRKQEKVPSCDQERQSALEEARQNSRQAFFIPDCGPGGLYKAVQCHQSTGYCWCVLVDTGRPIPGTSTRYQTPECDAAARSQLSGLEDPFQGRELPGCPEGKKLEFITSLLDALTTDMVHAINSPAPSGGGRFAEPDPSHTLEERVVHWYFAQLDNNSSHDINKKELKPLKRYLKKKAKPKKCARKFIDYCDLNKDRTISLQELKGCLGVSKEGSSTTSGTHRTSRSSSVRREGSRS